MLCRYFDESADNHSYSLKDLLYNLPFIHRAYNLTFKSQPELFIPIKEPLFVKKSNSTECFFRAEIEKSFELRYTLGKLPKIFEHDKGIPDKFIIRTRNNFRWEFGKKQKDDNLRRITNFHKKIRKKTYYIYGPTRLWYIKRDGKIKGLIDRSSLTITFSAMHKLSELARYSPSSLAKHFNSRHNWLLSEFISKSLYQFIDEISAEITGQEFMIPAMRSRELSF